MNSNVIYRPCVYMEISGNQEANISAGHLSSIRTRPTFSESVIISVMVLSPISIIFVKAEVKVN